MNQESHVIYTRDQHNISRNNIDEDALKIMYRLIRNGYKAFLVGGGVRDLLLSKKPKDFDISTDATPRRIKMLFRNSRIIGRRFKLVHVFFRGNKIIEVSTFRAENEVEEDEDPNQLKTDNVYGQESTDARRRDITINGLFYDLSSFSVIDYVGGMPDLKAGVIRVIGDPDTRFKEDPVRLLRVIRHAARNNFEINKECLDSLIKNRELILKSSAVRVYEEFKKDLLSGHFLEVLKRLTDSGMLDYILPLIAEKQKQLLSPDNLFYEMMFKVDRAVEQGEKISATAILSAIALALMQLDDNIVLDETNCEETAKDFVKNIFISLSVPRKERERIVNIICAMFELATRDPKRIRLSSLGRKPYFNDLLSIALVAGGGLLSAEVMNLLESASANVKIEKRDFDSNRAGRYFNRARRHK